ncbi:MAG: hypothetical protein HFJ12_02085 [Bacilli bacterium]|nr:hypothetical protein [Bacilli bacterium]
MESNENLIGNSRHMVDYLGNEYFYDCLGCEISKKSIPLPGGVIYEDDAFVLASEPEIPLAGFLVVTAKRHVNSIVEFTREERCNMVDIISRAVSILKELKITNEVTLIQEERSKHFHMWIFPHHDWMDQKFGRGVSYTRDICDYILDHATQDDKQKTLKAIQDIKEKF